MPKKKLVKTDETFKNQLNNVEKLPYVKPELHHLNLEGTEGKTSTGPVENTGKTTTTTINSGPS